MLVYVFAGPTLSAAEVRTELDAVVLPPAAQGDVYRAARTGPAAIGIVDGYFEGLPAVWHKEILWAMREGVHVFGSASMGALRAAELAPFGMEGVGTIFAAYLGGTLDADDEVAVAHGPPETGFRPQSEALVNIRATIDAAAGLGIVSAETRETLVRLARALFYPDRSYERLLQVAARQGVDPGAIETLRTWLPRGRVDQKRDDAVAMLRLMRDRLAAGLAPKEVRYTFEHTDIWEEARAYAGALQPGPAGVHEHLPLDLLLDEVRLQGAAAAAATFDAALARLLSADEARRHRMTTAGGQLQEVLDAFRRERGLHRAEDVERWLAANALAPPRFEQLLADEARRRWVRVLTRSETAQQVPDHLRLAGSYPTLLARARDKRGALESHGLPNPGLADAGLTEEEALWRWYFTERLRLAPPEDLALYASAAGFDDVEAMRRAVLRERCYLRMSEACRDRPA